MPSCEDRTVICDLTQIKEKEGMILTDNRANNTRNNGSYLAKFSYSCQQEGKPIPGYHTFEFDLLLFLYVMIVFLSNSNLSGNNQGTSST